jgi:O-succinylbenzoic acid--CoA ligase
MELRQLQAGSPSEEQAAAILDGLAAGAVVALAGEREQASLAAALAQAEAASSARSLTAAGAAVILGSGGSSGGRRWCLQPLSHLQASTDASAHWLERLGLNPAAAVIVNPLPLHHISGLMPLLRARRWGVPHQSLAAALLRDPQLLAATVPVPEQRPALLSLVPTQLERLLAVEAGRSWLARFALIWVGGAGLDPALAARARALALPLAPCYGATETAAMVCALPPQRFLAGEASCGEALLDVRLRLDPIQGAVEVATERLALGWLGPAGFEPLPLQPGGWWRSGDGGRLDGAIHSGGVTVFPDQLRLRLQAEARSAQLPLAALLLLPRRERPWGARLVALVRPQPGADQEALLLALQRLVAAWPPAERPRRWLLCPQLAVNAAGKWDRAHWQAWLDTALQSTGPIERP